MSECAVPVAYVLRSNAKNVKKALEGLKVYDLRYKICPASLQKKDERTCLESCVAIPVNGHEDILNMDPPAPWLDDIVAWGTQPCPHSCRFSGDTHRALVQAFLENTRYTAQLSQVHSHIDFHSLPILLHVLIHAIVSFRPKALSYDTVFQVCYTSFAHHQLVMPKKGLERIGDDGTLLLPQKVFSMDPLYNTDNQFSFIIHRFIDPAQIPNFLLHLWTCIAQTHSSPRLVRKGDIHPDSVVRKSEHVILWSNAQSQEPCPGWITITEQGIRQSFDLTKVMFSRGNISEKIRFGKLVQRGDIVLDLYAGIGYFTLPAVILGGAKHVYACEWNPHAVEALRFNVQQNHVQDQVTIYHGDCIKFFDNFHHDAIDNKKCCTEELSVDRVSLGLLPSSEDGWPVAVKALRRDRGGWLHIHGNIMEEDVETWTLYVCTRILALASERTWNGDSDKSPVVQCHHIECVKAFAPHVNHYVLDVFCGP